MFPTNQQTKKKKEKKVALNNLISEQGCDRLYDLLKFLVCYVVATLPNLLYHKQLIEIISEWVYLWWVVCDFVSSMSIKFVWYYWGTANTICNIQGIKRNSTTTIISLGNKHDVLSKRTRPLGVNGSETTPLEEDDWHLTQIENQSRQNNVCLETTIEGDVGKHLGW